MSEATRAAGPRGLELRFGADARVEDGWLVRGLRAAPGLDGPPGVLQGGFATGLAIEAARLLDRFGAPATHLHARLHAPTRLGRDLAVRVRPTEQAATYQVQTLDAQTLLVDAEVELAGHDTTPRVYDLVELADAGLAEPDPSELLATCWVCGHRPTHPLAQRMLPRWHDPDTVVCPWLAGDELGVNGRIHPVVVAAMLACPTAWASFRHVEERGDAVGLLAGYHLRFFADAPVMEPLRVVARCDDVQGRRLHTRGALLDEDGVVYATTAALYISVPRLPPDTIQDTSPDTGGPPAVGSAGR